MDSHLAANISRFKKERFLRQYTEDAFRDEVLRPLLIRQGLKDGRDLCGPNEKGKDCVFVSVDKLGMNDIYVVQTKQGPVNLAKEPSKNLLEAITQLKTALETPVFLPFTKEKKLPAKAILCASGKINEHARQHIVHEVDDPRIVFMDSDDLIPKIDEIFPELWYGIDAKVLPYLRAIRRKIEEVGEDLSLADMLPGGMTAATDDVFVPLSLYRFVRKIKKQKGQTVVEPKIEEIPPLALLRRPEQLFLILGEAGSGKSTALRRLAYLVTKKERESDKDFMIPVLLRAVDLVSETNTSLVELAAQETKRIMGASTPSFTQANLSSGHVILMIDALDELPDDHARRGVLGLISDYSVLYPKCKVVVTSREYSFIQELGDLQQYVTYRLSPLDYKQAEQIINRLRRGQSLPIERSKEIIRRLQDVHGMELNPLLVTVFAATSEYSRQDVPANITELFKKFTEMMLGRWDASKGLAHQYQAPLKDFLLKKIAFEMHRRRSTSMALAEFRKIMETELSSRDHKADIGQMLDEVLYRSGLFRIVGESVEFRHLLLQEFFAGRGIQSVDLLETVVSDRWWSRAIVFYFGENASDVQGVDRVAKAVSSRTPQEIFIATITIGLALQACYLSEVKEKVPLLRWVIESLSKTKSSFLEEFDPANKFPLSRFLTYYMFARDSVANRILEGRAEEFVALWLKSDLGAHEKEMRIFWTIIGLVECGALDEADQLTKQFKPSDPKLLLGIHLGCYLVQHVRVSNKAQKRLSDKICRDVADRIGQLRTDLLQEIKTELLEVRRDQIKGIIGPTVG